MKQCVPYTVNANGYRKHMSDYVKRIIFFPIWKYITRSKGPPILNITWPFLTNEIVITFGHRIWTVGWTMEMTSWWGQQFCRYCIYFGSGPRELTITMRRYWSLRDHQGWRYGEHKIDILRGGSCCITYRYRAMMLTISIKSSSIP